MLENFGFSELAEILFLFREFRLLLPKLPAAGSAVASGGIASGSWLLPLLDSVSGVVGYLSISGSWTLLIVDRPRRVPSENRENFLVLPFCGGSQLKQILSNQNRTVAS
jgi:hypothetical protein